MTKIGIFFGTETGTTRLIAKKIHKLLGDGSADKPVNVNRTATADFLHYDALILGVPSYGDGALPGQSANCIESNWEEFLQQLGKVDLSGKRIALFGLGAQERYADCFASSMIQLYRVLKDYGAEIVGAWSTEGYEFRHSASIIDGQFVGLVIDQRTQGMLTEQRIQAWVEQIKPLLIKQS
jgi:flavodoxin I